MESMEPLDVERRRQAWSSYWAAGGLHSCIGNLAEDRDGAIGRFWRTSFAGLRGGDRVLDLATGNGALPKLLQDEFGPGLRVDAIDLADVAPRWLAAQADAGIVFHPATRMEALPFPAGTFDFVASQFGLEYAQWPAALDEAVRVCAPGGRLAFVMHHADSIVLQTGRAEQAHQRFLLAEGGLFAAAAALLPHMVRVQAGAQPDASAERARRTYNDAMQQVAGRIVGSASADVLQEARERIHAIVGGRFGNEPGRREHLFESYVRAFEDAALRTSELLACGLDEPRAYRLAEALRARREGWRVDCRKLEQAEGLVAWGINAG